MYRSKHAAVINVVKLVPVITDACLSTRISELLIFLIYSIPMGGRGLQPPTQMFPVTTTAVVISEHYMTFLSW